MLEKLDLINPGNKAISFLHKRIMLNDYRGLQFSQHNRYNREQVKIMLQEMFNTVGENLMQIRTTDLSKRPYSLPGEEKYVSYVRKLNKTLGRCTEDSVRKNFFVDFDRMGFLYRFDKNKNLIPSKQRASIKYVKLSPLGIDLIKADNIFQENLIYTEGLKNILGDLIEDLMLIITNLTNNKITLIEYTYFISFLNQKLNGNVYQIDDIIELIKEFRTIPKLQIRSINELVKEYCSPSRFKGNKTNKRDFHNWLNESQQVFMLLGQTIYFIYNKKEQVLKPRIGTNEIDAYDNLKNYQRSAIVKKLYFDKHKVKKTPGYELHHIIALNLAKNRNDFFLYDSWENLLYIDGKTHSILSQTNNVNNILQSDGPNLMLLDHNDNMLYLTNKHNVLYDVNLQAKLINYNQKLLQR